jgi:hypothetical protein
VTEHKKQASPGKKDVPGGPQRKKNRKRTSSGNPATEQTFNQKLRELVKMYKGFDPWEKEHRAESDIERRVCKHLDNNGIEHKHRNKRFNVVLRGSKAVVFVPDIIIPHPRIESKPILVHTLNSHNDEIAISVLREFKKQLGAKYYLVVVTTKDEISNIPGDMCDLLLAVEYAASLPAQLKSQAKLLA